MRKKVLTDSARQVDVVVLAVHLLGGNQKSVDTEDVAVRAHELAPGMFAWRKHPDRINLELVRVNLSNAKKAEYGQLLTGSGREGWRLSTSGLEWIKNTGKGLLSGSLSWAAKGRSAGSVDTVRKQREKARLLGCPAWKDWSAGKAIARRDAHDVFRIDNYATEKMLSIKLVRLRSLFDDDEDVSAFLKQVQHVILNEEVGEDDKGAD